MAERRLVLEVEAQVMEEQDRRTWRMGMRGGGRGLGEGEGGSPNDRERERG